MGGIGLKHQHINQHKASRWPTTRDNDALILLYFIHKYLPVLAQIQKQNPSHSVQTNTDSFFKLLCS